jgi:hypothetical protein
MSRLWALIAEEEKSERPACINRLQQDLASPAMTQDRLLSVSKLVRLLRLEDRHTEIRPLLENELKHAAHSEAPDILARLKQMLHGETEGQALTLAITRWLQQNAPPWFENLPPYSLTEAGIEDEDANLDEKAEHLPPLSRIKLWLLAAQETALLSEERIRWFANALASWSRIQSLTRDEFHTAFAALLDDSQAPPSLKSRVLRIAAITCADLDEPSLYQQLSERVENSSLDEGTRSILDVVDMLFATDPASPAAAKQAVETLLKRKDSHLLELLVEWLTNRAIRHGRLDTSQAVAAALAPARKPAGFESSVLQTLRLRLVKKNSSVKRLLPVHETLAKIILEHPVHPHEKNAPADSALLGGPDHDALGAAAWIAAFRQDMRRGVFGRTDLAVWHTCASAFAELDAAGTWSTRRRVISALAAAPVEDDLTRAELVELAKHFTDIDSSEERAHLVTALKPWREQRQPATLTAIRLKEAHIALRNGQALDLEALIRQIKDPDASTYLRWIQLRRSLATDDAALARKVLDTLGADDLLDHSRLLYVIPALKLTRQQDELALALEEATEAFQHALGRAWTGRHSSAPHYALELASMLGTHDALPPGWLDFCLHAYPERMGQLSLQSRLAQLREDWPAALEAATELVEKYPTFYSHYWPKAQALWKLGRTSEALAPLKIYLHHCHDEIHHVEASRLLAELETQKR